VVETAAAAPATIDSVSTGEESATPSELNTSDFVECYVTHYGRLVRALVLSGADRATAEDVAQEAFSRSLVVWGRVSKGSNPAGYVYTTAFRLLQRHSRRAFRWRGGGADDAGALAADPRSQTEETATTSVALETVLARMPPKRRACAVMCLLVGLSVSEASDALGIAEGTVRKHLEAARKDLSEVRG
jgi:RNA polymerase sigma factor (sigma-70 family)